jgi:nicotinate dehydrogenase subunit B
MKSKKEDQFLAPEQYELHAEPSYSFSMNRRTFFHALGSGIAVTFSIGSSLGSSLTDTAPEDQLASWIHINENGTVKIFTGKAEVGQNIRTSLAQIVAEELDVPMQRIEMIMGDTALTPYDRGTFGSRSIPYMGPQLRQAAATAREVLIDMAAEEWKAERSQLYVKEGQVVNRNTKATVDIGKLTKGKQFIKPVDEKVKVTPVEQWKVAGTSVPKVNGENFITGRHKYVSDMKLPGMLYGKVLRAPAYGAVLLDVDTSAAKEIKGVIIIRDGDFIGVVAPELSTAEQALKIIIATWDTKPQPSRAEIFEYLKKNASQASGRDSEGSGDVNSSFNTADVKMDKSYYIDYIAHAPLEPRAGLAQWEGNNLTVWTGTQRPFGVQEELEKLFKIPRANIRVIQPDTGSGYGGKHTGEAGIEAARLSKECQKPVKVVWTREEEFTWAYFRPAGVIEIKAGATKDGVVTSWEFHNYNSGGSGIETPYEVTNKKIQFHPVDSPLRQGSYRGLAATANVFARESVMNDLAEEIKMDPLAFRLKNLSEPRMKGVLEAAAKKFGWTGKASSPGRGVGIACGTEKASYVATCAEVSVDPDSGNVKVERVVVSFECGAIINPEHLENQIQGSVVQGLGGALFERIDFQNGRILNPAFSRYRVPRFSDMPQLEVVMVNRKDIPSAGAGETPILGIAPAVRNAIANATGKKLYTLPLVPDGLKSKGK